MTSADQDEMHELRSRLRGALEDNVALQRRIERLVAAHALLERDLEQKTHALNQLLLSCSEGRR